jgi:uncharacterized protein with HEPN domain
MNEAQKRFWQTMRLVDKEAMYLRDVLERLFVPADVTPSWLAALIQSPEGRDRLEAFVGKFTRLQDTLIDKLLPQFLSACGEVTGSVLDNLNRAERLRLLAATDHWLAMRQLRNRLVHEYVEDATVLAAALNQARGLAGELLALSTSLRSQAEEKFPEQK